MSVSVGTGPEGAVKRDWHGLRALVVGGSKHVVSTLCDLGHTLLSTEGWLIRLVRRSLVIIGRRDSVADAVLPLNTCL